MTNNEICAMDALTVAKNVRSKALSPVEVINAVLERMEKLEPVLHAFCTPTPDIAKKAAGVGLFVIQEPYNQNARRS